MLDQEQVYQEAGNWVRSANAWCWTVGAIFIPLSISAFVLAVEKPQHVYWLAFGSLFLWSIWVYMVVLYSRSVRPCRDVLERIEAQSGLPEELVFYRQQGRLFHGRWGSKYLVAASTATLILGWLALIITLA